MPSRPTSASFADASPAVVLGIDPGLNRTGYAVLRSGPRPELIEAGVLKSDAGDDLAVRLGELAAGLRELIAEHRPVAAGVEMSFVDPARGNHGSVLKLTHCRGGLITTLATAGVRVFTFAPASLKKGVTGSGKASKEDVQEATRSQLRLSKVLKPNDASDAAAAGLCACKQLILCPLSPNPEAK